jgi:hypothetical protein
LSRDTLPFVSPHIVEHRWVSVKPFLPVACPGYVKVVREFRDDLAQAMQNKKEQDIFAWARFIFLHRLLLEPQGQKRGSEQGYILERAGDSSLLISFVNPFRPGGLK